MSLCVSIPPNSTPSGWAVGISAVMLAMSAPFGENRYRVGSRLTKSDGQDRDGLVEQASLRSQPSGEDSASPNAPGQPTDRRKGHLRPVHVRVNKAWDVRQPSSLQPPIQDHQGGHHILSVYVGFARGLGARVSEHAGAMGSA